MSNRYLNKFHQNENTEYDKQIKSHLEKAKREIMSALRVIAERKKMNMAFRLASKSTEMEILGLLSLIDKVRVIKPMTVEEEISPKEKRLQRRNKGKVENKGVTNVRRNRR